MSQAERDGIQREPVRGEEATEPGAPRADDPARTADPREQGVADGYAGGPYNEDLFYNEHGAAYRAGLQEGRTAAVDEELLAAHGPEPAEGVAPAAAEAEPATLRVPMLSPGGHRTRFVSTAEAARLAERGWTTDPNAKDYFQSTAGNADSSTVESPHDAAGQAATATETADDGADGW
jgi:hypothetical protein